MKNAKIRTKLILSFTIIIILVVFFAISITWQNRIVINKYHDVIEKYDVVSIYLAKIDAYSSKARVKVEEAVSQDTMSEATYQKEIAVFEETEKKIATNREKN